MLPERPSVSNAESFHAVKTSDSVQTIVVVRFAKSRTYAELYLSYSLDRQAPAPNCSTFVNENRTNDSCRSHRSVVHELGLLLRPSVSAVARVVVSINEPRAFTTAVSNDATHVPCVYCTFNVGVRLPQSAIAAVYTSIGVLPPASPTVKRVHFQFQ